MPLFDIYKHFGGEVNDVSRCEESYIDSASNNPKAAPAGNYWIAYEPDFDQMDALIQRSYGDALANLRPALLVMDGVTMDDDGDINFKSPTEYAKRWGLHEDGPPGRSRTSLTRSDTRTFRKAGVSQPVTGKWVAEYFQKKASEENMDLGDWLEHSLPRTALSEDDKVYLDWLDSLFRDEMWQGMLFHDFTMDEVSARYPVTAFYIDEQKELTGFATHG